MPPSEPASDQAPAAGARGPRWLREGLRWVLLAVAVAVLALAGLLITGLRRQAVESRRVDQRLIDVRYLVSDADRAAWQLVAQGTPNFTFSQQIKGDLAQIATDLRAVRSVSPEGEVTAVRSWTPAFDRQLVNAEQLVAAGHPALAQHEVLIGADGTAQLIQQTVHGLASTFSHRATAANDRLYIGTLIILGTTATLMALLAGAFTRGRRRAAEAEYQATERSERRFRALVQRASEVVVLCDPDRTVRYVTDTIRDLFGLDPADLVGRRIESLLPPAHRPRAQQLFARAVIAPREATPTEWELARPSGERLVLRVRSNNLLHDPDVEGIVLTGTDVTTRLEMEAQLRHQALHDPLTGLTNRVLFEDRVAQALHRAGRQAGPAAVVYGDLDGFKTINDSLGHGAGDALLRTVAGRIDECLRGGDTSARLGGDEFACLLEDLEDLEQAVSVAERLIEALARPMTIQGRTIAVRASMGIAYGSGPEISAEQLIRNADLAMYKAKAERRGGVVVFDDDLLVSAQRHLELRADLEQAVDRDELGLVYQPLIDLDSGGIVGLEALVRWHHPRHGTIAPDRFIPLAEETGLIVDIGRWVVDRALADLAGWSVESPELTVNVNVAPRELTVRSYVGGVCAALERHGVAAHRLTLELTESELLDADETARRLHDLADRGIQLAIDDFGTGQSSLARLQHLPVSQVKIDRSFLQRMDESPLDATLVRSMIELGQALGLQMVAEGLERESQVMLLTTSPRPIGQGFLFARPRPAAAIGDLLTGGTLIG